MRHFLLGLTDRLIDCAVDCTIMKIVYFCVKPIVIATALYKSS